MLNNHWWYFWIRDNLLHKNSVQEKNVIYVKNFIWPFSSFIKYFSDILIKLLWYINIVRSYFSQIGTSYVSNQGSSTREDLEGFNPTPINILTQEHFENIVVNAFPCVVLFASNLVLRQLNVLIWNSWK